MQRSCLLYSEHALTNQMVVFIWLVLVNKVVFFSFEFYFIVFVSRLFEKAISWYVTTCLTTLGHVTIIWVMSQLYGSCHNYMGCVTTIWVV